MSQTPRFSAPRTPHYFPHPFCPQDCKGRPSTLFLPASQDAPASAPPDLPLATPKELRKSFLHTEGDFAVCSAVGNSNKNLADVQNSAACSSKLTPASLLQQDFPCLLPVLNNYSGWNALGHRTLRLRKCIQNYSKILMSHVYIPLITFMVGLLCARP